MFTIVSKNKGFYKLEKDKIFYNVSAKKFAKLEEEGLISSKIQESSKISEETRGLEQENIEIKKDDSQDLSKLKKDDLAELAKRLGFEGEITKDVTKADLVEFIKENS